MGAGRAFGFACFSCVEGGSVFSGGGFFDRRYPIRASFVMCTRRKQSENSRISAPIPATGEGASRQERKYFMIHSVKGFHCHNMRKRGIKKLVLAEK